MEKQTLQQKMGDTILTLKEVADYLQKGERSVLQLIKDGKLRGFKSRGVWRFRESDVIRYIEEETQRTMDTL